MTIQVNWYFNLEKYERVENEYRNEGMKTWRIMKEPTSSGWSKTEKEEIG